MIDIFEKRHAILVTEFDRYVMEHPEFAAKIPLNAQIVLQIQGDEEYNEWSRKLALFVNKFTLSLTLLFLLFSYFILPSRTDFINTVAGAIPFIVFFAFIFNLKKDEVKSLFIE